MGWTTDWLFQESREHRSNVLVRLTERGREMGEEGESRRERGKGQRGKDGERWRGG